MMEQRVHQRAVGIASGGMHDEPGRLVEHNQMFVFEHDLQRDVLRDRCAAAASGGIEMLKDLSAARMRRAGSRVPGYRMRR